MVPIFMGWFFYYIGVATYINEMAKKMTWKCWFFHDWTCWSDVRFANVLGMFGYEKMSIQNRVCKRCNKSTWRYA